MKDLNNNPLPLQFIPEEVHTEVLRKVISGDHYEVYRHWVASGHAIEMFLGQIRSLEAELARLKK